MSPETYQAVIDEAHRLGLEDGDLEGVHVHRRGLHVEETGVDAGHQDEDRALG